MIEAISERLDSTNVGLFVGVAARCTTSSCTRAPSYALQVAALNPAKFLHAIDR